MTTATFDASASTTPYARTRAFPAHNAGISRKQLRRRIIRIAWLITRLVRRDIVRFELYRDRFDLGLRTFRRDVASIRDAGVYVDTDPQLGYSMICFRPEADAT